MLCRLSAVCLAVTIGKKMLKTNAHFMGGGSNLPPWNLLNDKAHTFLMSCLQSLIYTQTSVGLSLRMTYWLATPSPKHLLLERLLNDASTNLSG